jgi:hypothetical protein
MSSGRTREGPIRGKDPLLTQILRRVLERSADDPFGAKIAKFKLGDADLLRK